MSEKTTKYPTKEITFYPEETTEEMPEWLKVHKEGLKKDIASGKYPRFDIPDDKRRERRFTTKEKREIVDMWQQKLGSKFTFDMQLFKEGSDIPYWIKNDYAVFIRIVGPMVFTIRLKFDYDPLFWALYQPFGNLFYPFTEAHDMYHRGDHLTGPCYVEGICLPEVIFDKITKCNKHSNQLNIDLMKPEFTLEDFRHYYTCGYLATEYLIQSKDYNRPHLIHTFGYDIHEHSYNNIKRPMSDGHLYRDSKCISDHMAKIASWTGNLKKAKEYLDWGYEIYSRERYSQEEMKKAEVIEDCNNWYNSRKYLVESPERIRSIVRKNKTTPFHMYSQSIIKCYDCKAYFKNLQHMPVEPIAGEPYCEK